VTRRRNPRAGRTCDRCRRELPRRRRPYAPTALCARCRAEQNEERRNRRAGDRILYTPLDEILELPAVRILRALRWFGWVEADELLLVAGAPEHWEDRQAFHQALSRITRAGHADRWTLALVEGKRIVRTQRYQITESGRRELARRLTVDMEVARDIGVEGSAAA